MKTLKLTHTLMLFILLLCFSCKKSKEEPEVPAALNELMSTTTNCICEPYISRYLWKDKYVYVWSTRGPACNSFPIFFDENGKEFKMETGYSFDDFMKDSSDEKTIWSCK